MTDDPVLQALIDLCEQVEYALGRSSTRFLQLEEAHKRAKDVIRDRVSPGGLSE